MNPVTVKHLGFSWALVARASLLLVLGYVLAISIVGFIEHPERSGSIGSAFTLVPLVAAYLAVAYDLHSHGGSEVSRTVLLHCPVVGILVADAMLITLAALDREVTSPAVAGGLVLGSALLHTAMFSLAEWAWSNDTQVAK
ncbi:MAG: hypothetical protein ACREON_15385 [Gemmatimonadaceae bacterium]